MLEVLDAPAVARWCRAGLDALGGAREEIDALNVFPVPDGDTGTNLFLTMESATHAAERAVADGVVAGGGSDVATVLTAMAGGAFQGARGNSGVILSELLRAAAQTLAAAPRADGRALARALRHAADSAYTAVSKPIEGTILTVAAAAATAAEASVGSAASAVSQHGAGTEEASLAAVAEAAAMGARAALVETSTLLPILARSGVVDAGGRGLCVLLDALTDTVVGVSPLRPVRTHVPVPADATVGPDSAFGPEPAASTTTDQRGGTRRVVSDSWSAVDGCAAQRDGGAGGAFEVMYLLDADTPAVEALRERLSALGGSLVVVGGDGRWNVHVHTDDAGAAVEAGIEAGRPHGIRVTHLALASPWGHPPPGRFLGDVGSRNEALGSVGTGWDATAHPGVEAPPSRPVRVVLVLATAEGLADVFEEAGAQVMLAAGPGLTSARILDAVRRAGAGEVVLVSCDADQHVAASVAAEQAQQAGVRTSLVPAKAPVQAIASLAVHETGRRFDADVVTMTAAAGATRVGALSVAADQAWTSAGVCEAGDVLGLIDGDVAVIGPDLADVAVTVVERMLAGGGELVTLVTGGPDASMAAGLVGWVTTHLRAFRPEVDTTVYAGGLTNCPLMIGVE